MLRNARTGRQRQVGWVALHVTVCSVMSELEAETGGMGGAQSSSVVGELQANEKPTMSPKTKRMPLEK